MAELSKKGSFSEAEELLKKGKYVKLPSWKGFWFLHKETGDLLVLTKDNEILDTPHEHYKKEEGWSLAKSNPAQNKLLKSFYDSKTSKFPFSLKKKEESSNDTGKGGKIWTRKRELLESVEDSRNSILVLDEKGDLTGGKEFYGKPLK